MPRTARQISESGYYHVVLRGIGRQILFEDDAERLDFLAIVKRYCNEFGLRVIAWCLMSNHVHLLVDDPEGMLSEAMKRIALSYAQRHNRRTGHVGHVFEDRFSSKPITSDAQLVTAVEYIHDNPAKAGISTADSYRWSSCREYAGAEGPSDGLADTSTVLEMLGGWNDPERVHAGKDVADPYQEPAGRKRMTDTEARSALDRCLDSSERAALEGQDKKARNNVIAKLKQAGLSVRQIERMTGIGRGVIERAR